MTTLYRAEKLIDLACSTTHAEEARTAALSACRLIRKLGLRLTADGPRPEVARARREQPAPQRRPEPVRAKPPNGGAWQPANRWGKCEGCGDRIAAGDHVYVVSGATWCDRH
jgi:hypothetical protein